MKPVLLSFNEANFETQKVGTEILLNNTNEVVIAFNAMGFEPIKQNELHRLFYNTTDLLYDKITKGEKLSIAGVEIDKAAAMQFIKKPDGFEVVVNKINIAKNTYLTIMSDYKLSAAKSLGSDDMTTSFDMNDKGELEVRAVTMEELKKSNELYATSDRAIKLFELASLVLEKSKDPVLLEMIKTNGDGVLQIFKGLFPDHDYGQGPKIDFANIVRHNSDLYKY